MRGRMFVMGHKHDRGVELGVKIVQQMKDLVACV
jgi:hypothetical protein